MIPKMRAHALSHDSVSCSFVSLLVPQFLIDRLLDNEPSMPNLRAYVSRWEISLTFHIHWG